MKNTLKPQMHVMGISCRTTNREAHQNIPQLWGRIQNEPILENIPNKVSNEIIALYCEYESDHTQAYTLIVGCEVSHIDQIPQGMVAKTVPAAIYSVFPVQGESPKEIFETWQTVWKSDLKRAYTYDMEVYDANKVTLFISSKEFQVEERESFYSSHESILFDGLNKNAFKAKGMQPIQSFGFFIKDAKNTVAGVTGIHMYGCQYVDMLWVDEAYREKGLGTLLIQAAEDLARKHRCTFATVNTMDFEAFAFYQKLGYNIEFTREGFEKGAKMYLLRKSI